MSEPSSSKSTPTSIPHRRLALNAISNLSRYFVSVVVAFLLTPYVVRTLGNSTYGVWVLVLSVIGYASILELGVQPAIVRLIGHYGPENRKKLDQLISTAFAVFLGVGSVLAIVIGVLGLTFAEQSGARAEHPHATWLVVMIALDVALMFQLYLLSGVLFGLHRYPLRNAIDVGAIVVNALLVVGALSHFGITALAGAKLAADVISVLALSVAVRRALPALRLSRDHISRDTLRELFLSGGPLFASSTATRAANYAQPIIITTALSSAATTFYAIPLRLIDYSREILYALVAGFMPTFSELARLDRRRDLTTIYVKYSRVLVLVTLPVNVLVFVLGVGFITLWLGPEYASRGRLVVYFLTGAVFLESCQPLIWRLMIGVGHLRQLVFASILGSSVNLVGAIVLVHPFGISGVALPILVSTALTQSVFTVFVSRYLGMGTLALVRATLLRPLVVGSVTLATAILLSCSRGIGTASYASLALIAAVTVAVHVALTLVIGIDQDERRLLFRRVREWTGRRVSLSP